MTFRNPGKTLDEQIEGDHAYRDEPPTPELGTPRCPACNEHGKHYEEDQYMCDNPRCRTVIYHGYGQT